jgi:PKD repeat protein
VKFKNLSEQATSFEWDFDGLGTSTDKEPSFTFPSDGDYQVILKAKNDTNSCLPAFDTIMVKIQTPLAKFDKDSFIYCVSEKNKLISANLSSGFVSDGQNAGFLWEFFPDTIPKRTKTSAILYDYKDTLTKNVILSVRNYMNCIHKDTALFIIDSIYATPKIDSGFCSKDTVKFLSNIKSRFPLVFNRWYFGDGDSATMTDNDTFHIYKSSIIPTFTTKLEAKNIYGCKNITYKLINKRNFDLTLDPVSKNLCLGKDSIIKIKSKITFPGEVKWRFAPLDTQMGKEIDRKFLALGTYNIQIQTNTGSISQRLLVNR